MKGIESRLTGGYWGRRQAVNRESAIVHHEALCQLYFLFY